MLTGCSFFLRNSLFGAAVGSCRSCRRLQAGQASTTNRHQTSPIQTRRMARIATQEGGPPTQRCISNLSIFPIIRCVALRCVASRRIFNEPKTGGLLMIILVARIYRLLPCFWLLFWWLPYCFCFVTRVFKSHANPATQIWLSKELAKAPVG